MVTRYLTDGGIPDGWSYQNLHWLAQAHRRLAQDPATRRVARAAWHTRWATLIEDVLETYRVNGH